MPTRYAIRAAWQLDPAGDLFVADSGNTRVLAYLNPLASMGGTPGTPGSPGDTTADLVFGQGATGTSFTTQDMWRCERRSQLVLPSV